MFNRETRTGLAPKSWTAVGVWLVIAAVVISRPGESLGLFFGTVIGTGQWVGYTAFADCGEPPPMDWMEPKPCPKPDISDPTTAPESPPSPPGEDDTAADRYVVNVDEHAIRSVLDAGAAAVVGLHGEVTEIQAAGGLTVNVGSHGGDRGG